MSKKDQKQEQPQTGQEDRPDTPARIAAFAATIEDEGEREIFMSAAAAGNETLLRGHFPAFYA